MGNPNFKTSELIATGGMASIYKGVQLSLDRPVAIKRLHPHLTTNADFVTRFEKEAKSIARLRHENIVSIVDFGRDEEGYYLVMEFVDGKNLKEIIKSEKKIPAEIGLIIAEQVAQGLRFAHSSGLVHRDIKPANIMLSKNGAVKITDFGIAKFANDISLTDTGSMIGSPAYMSPEHVRGTDFDNRSDIFSLGVVLYEILSGEKPFQGENYQEVITKILTEEPRLILQIAPELSAGLAEIIHRCLQKDKLKRYQNCEDLLLDIKKQIDFYQIQLAPKLISQYLENPALVSSWLLGERIQRHLDWGLHYFNQGEEKKGDAKKEFLEVLRWDPHNQTALKCLAQIDQKQKKGNIKLVSGKLRQKRLYPWILAPIGLAAAVLLGYLSAGYMDKLSGPSTLQKSKDRSQVNSNSPGNGLLTAPEEGLSFGQSASPPIVTSKEGSKSGSLTSSSSGAIILYNQEKEKERVRQAGKVSLGQLRAKAQFGTLKVNAEPKAIVEINGKNYGSVPPALTFKAEEGKYRVCFSRKGYRAESKKIWVEKGKTATVTESLIRDKPTSSKNPRSDEH